MGRDEKKRRSRNIWKKKIEEIGNEKGKSSLNKTKNDRWTKNKQSKNQPRNAKRRKIQDEEEEEKAYVNEKTIRERFF